MSKIKKVTVKDVRRIEGEQIIEPESDVIVITGPNRQGKTSFITAMTSVFEGGKSLPPDPINHDSADGKARVEVLLDNGLTLTRKITKSGTTLEIIDENGLSIQKAQAYVDQRLKLFAINPLEFAESDPAAQAKMAKKVLAMVVGTDMAPIAQYLKDYKQSLIADASVVEMIDALIADNKGVVYMQRRDLTRHIGTLEGALPPKVDGKPPAKMDEIEAQAGEIEKQRLSEVEKINSYIEADRALFLMLDSIKSAADNFRIASEIIGENHLKDVGIIIDSMVLYGANTAPGVINTVRQTIDELKQSVELLREKQHAIAEEIGAARAVAETEKRDAITREKLATARKQLEGVETDLAALRGMRETIIASAKSPVEGLAVEGDRVTIGGIPFEQCSQSERLEVSVKLGMSLSPELRVMRITDGNSLDRAAFAMLCKLVEEQDFQLWIERVADDDNGVGFFFMEGKIAGVPNGK